MTSPYSSTEDLASNISSACRMDSKYDPKEDIQNFIDAPVKPDILITIDSNNKLGAYSNDVKNIGKIVVWSEYSSETLDVINVLTPKTIKGSCSDWIEKSFENKDIKEFLEEFIEKNTET